MLLIEPESLFIDEIRLKGTTTDIKFFKLNEDAMPYPTQPIECMIGMLDNTDNNIDSKTHQIGSLIEETAIHKALVVISKDQFPHSFYSNMPLFSIFGYGYCKVRCRYMGLKIRESKWIYDYYLANLSNVAIPSKICDDRERFLKFLTVYVE